MKHIANAENSERFFKNTKNNKKTSPPSLQDIQGFLKEEFEKQQKAFEKITKDGEIAHDIKEELPIIVVTKPEEEIKNEVKQ